MSNSLDQALDSLVPGGRRKGPECQLGVLLRELPPKTSEKLLEKIDNQDIPTTHITDVLNKSGHDISIHAVRRHRHRGTSGGCVCK